MRVLHVGSGFRPLFTGGLISYVEELAAEQARRGDEVAYFFHGRYLPRSTRPQLRRRRRGQVTMLELFNGPVIPGRSTLDPDQELAEPATENAFRAAMAVARPQLVHVHALSGLPSSLLEIPRERRVPVLLTVHDYHLLCPTIKLYDARGQNCTRLAPGAMCQVCCAHASGAPTVRRTFEAMLLRDERRMMRANNLLNAVRHRPFIARTLRRDARVAAPPAPAPARSAEPAAYDRRRAVNLRRLADLDAILPVSRGAAVLCRRLGVPGERL